MQVRQTILKEKWEHMNSIKYNVQIDRIEAKVTNADTPIIYQNISDASYSTMLVLNRLDKEQVQKQMVP